MIPKVTGEGPAEAVKKKALQFSPINSDFRVRVTLRECESDF